MPEADVLSPIGPRKTFPWGVITMLSMSTSLGLDLVWSMRGCGCRWNPPTVECRFLLPFLKMGIGLALVVTISSWILALIQGPFAQRARAMIAIVIGFGVLSEIRPPGTYHHLCRTIGEMMAIRDTFAIVSFESEFAKLNGGRYGPLECFASPGRCVPDYPPSGRALKPESLSPERQGYRCTLHPGRAAPGAAASPTWESFAYIAVPIVPGRDGIAAFCGDSTGMVCYTLGEPPPLTRGRCDVGEASPCRPLDLRERGLLP